MLQISDLFIYPIKSLGGIAVNEAVVTDRGFAYDRRWMLIDSHNRFLSQRQIPKMALLKVAFTATGLSITYAPVNTNIEIPFESQTSQFAEVSVWDDVCTGQYVSQEADEWFSNILNIPCRLVFMPDETLRQVDRKYAAEGMITSFADAFPMLLISQASLDDLSRRVGWPVSMNRFRPNIVYTGGNPYAEDELAHFTIGNIDFYGVKLCARCPIPGIDQDTAISGKEPIKTLSAYRRRQNKIYFGQNLIHSGTGVLKLGDTLQVLEVKDAGEFD
jgi:uncharacterized protein YcbX